MESRCEIQKRSKFDRLRCVLEVGHDGLCNFVVIGVTPCHGERSRPRTASDKEYEKHRRRYLSSLVKRKDE